MAKADPGRFDDLFAAFGAIRLRAMFGGEGIYRGDLMFGLVFEDRIFLKVDDATRSAYEAEGCKPFTYPLKDGAIASMKYYALPERLYDDPDELADWAQLALAIAAAKPKAKPKAKKRR